MCESSMKTWLGWGFRLVGVLMKGVLTGEPFWFSESASPGRGSLSQSARYQGVKAS